MSVSFHVALDRPPTFEESFRGAPPGVESDLGVLEDLVGAWDEGQIGAIWIPGVTTRPVELSWENGEFGARVLMGACAEDCTLALDVVCELAQGAGVDIVAEDGEAFSPDDRGNAFGPAWVEQHVESMAAMALAPQLMGASAEGEAVLELPGPLGTFYLGPLVRSRVEDSPNKADALFETMREALHYDQERYARMNRYEATHKDGTPLIVTTYAGRSGQVLEPADMLLVQADPKFTIDRSALPELLGEDAITWLDDRTWRLEPLEPAAWESFVERARAHASAVEIPPSGAGCRSCLSLLLAMGAVGALLYWWLS